MKSSSAHSRYKDFHGRASTKSARALLKPIRELVYLADAEYITYKSNKKNGGGDGTPQKFVHKFGKKIGIYTNPEGTILLIAGVGMHITDRGIVG